MSHTPLFFRDWMTHSAVVAMLLIGPGLPLTSASYVQKPAEQALVLQNGHASSYEHRINAIAFSPTQSFFATGSSDYTVRLWDARRGLLVAVLAGHTGPVHSLAFSPNGRVIASGSQDGTIRLWSVESCELTQTLVGHKSHVKAVAFSPDGRIIASGGGWYGEASDNSLRLWDVQTGRQIRLLSGHTSWVNSLAFARIGDFLISGGNDGTIRYWSIAKGENTLTIENKRTHANGSVYDATVEQIAVDTSSTTLAVVLSDEIQIRTLSDGTLRRRIPSPTGYFSSFVVSNDLRMGLAPAAGDSTVQPVVIDLRQGSRVRTLAGHDSGFVCGTFSPDSNTVVTGDSNSVIRICDAASGRVLHSLQGHSSAANAATYNATGTRLAWSNDNHIKLWDITSGRLLYTLDDHTSRVTALAFSPDGKTLVSGSAYGGSINVWSTSDGRLLRKIGGAEGTYAIAFSPDGTILASGSPDSGEVPWVDLWDFRTGRLARRLAVPSNLSSSSESGLGTYTRVSYARPRGGDSERILSVAFSLDGRKVIAAHKLGYALLWNLQTRASVQVFKGSRNLCTSVAFMPDERTIALGGYGIDVFNVADGRLLRTLDQHTDYINAIKFSPDGRMLASASNDRTIRMWDPQKGSQLRVLDYHSSGVNSIDFSRDGRFLASASVDSSVKISATGSGSLIATITSFDDGNWVINTPDNYFNASIGSDKYISWRVGTEVRDASRFRQQYQRPEILQSRIRTGVSPVLASSNDTRFVPGVRSEAFSLTTAEKSLVEKWKAVRYHALVVGNAIYQNLQPSALKTPVKDAEDVARALEGEFGFQVGQPLINASRRSILAALDRYKDMLEDNDCLLIYYAGHGSYDQSSGVAYWLPTEARLDDTSTWISSDDVINRIRGMKARHVLVVADSCFSGGLFGSQLGSRQEADEKEVYLDEMMRKSSRWLMTSGSLEFVDDAGEDGHSVFTHAFLKGLRSIQSNIFTAQFLFDRQVKGYVVSNSRQIPLLGRIPYSGRLERIIENGDFVFIRRRR